MSTRNTCSKTCSGSAGTRTRTEGHKECNLLPARSNSNKQTAREAVKPHEAQHCAHCPIEPKIHGIDLRQGKKRARARKEISHEKPIQALRRNTISHFAFLRDSRHGS
jgi:hypothetical protein